MKLRSLTTLALLFSVALAAGCANTIRGVGQDTANSVNAVQGAGNKVANAAE